MGLELAVQRCQRWRGGNSAYTSGRYFWWLLSNKVMQEKLWGWRNFRSAATGRGEAMSAAGLSSVCSTSLWGSAALWGAGLARGNAVQCCLASCPSGVCHAALCFRLRLPLLSVSSGFFDVGWDVMLRMLVLLMTHSCASLLQSNNAVLNPLYEGCVCVVQKLLTGGGSA